ncbi:FAD-binding domain-containing protein [Xylaria bambusicola]|uniref:FAD-binding domain-containing protein n=1 Tax=Xylaria bambusicola TaxID=326684 RepID=UPI0020085F8E|nr:FAD-binding domain-containing protein [Xylaria bambusicola]KAI0516777.1 FAD-binding domain-containing protein [Xylaria bambusicola]
MLFSQKAIAAAACNALQSVLPGQIIWPGSEEYSITSIKSIWSTSCHLNPECVFEPLNTGDLSTGIKVIKEHGAKFAVKGGGHMPNPGAQSVDEGVMISMSKFNGKSLSEDKSIANIGAGQLWAEVYNWLAQYGLAVNGGRYPTVGTAGVLLGGGMGYFSGARGWSIDDVVGWEVVLADGSIVEVTTDPDSLYSDLAWALRGGHNNLGVVTRFSMRTFGVTSAYGGLAVYNSGAEEGFYNALVSYMRPGGGSDDPKSAINAVSTLTLVDGSWSYGFFNVYMHAGEDPSPRSFENFTAIPKEHVTLDATELHQSWTSIPNSMVAVGAHGSRQLFWAITLKADRQSIAIANRTFYSGAFADLGGVEGLSLVVSYQSLTSVWLQKSKEKGGNLMGLDPERDGGSFATILISTWSREEDDEAILAFTRKASGIIEAETKKLGLFNPFIYLNDAAKDQKPFERYAGGTNLPRLRDIQVKYDPDGFIRNYLQHGFDFGLGEAGQHSEL